MSSKEVRNIIGLPLRRKRWKTGGWYWIYSQPLRPDKPYKRFVVVFDNQTNKVVNRFQCIRSASKDPMSGQWIGLAGPFASPWEITTFDYPMIQGKPPILKVRVGKAYLIQIMASWCGPCKKGLNRIKKLLEEDSSGFPIEFLVVSVDSSKQSLLEYLSKNQDVTPVAWDPNNHVSERMNQTLVPRYLVLKGKTLYPFDFPHRSGESEAYYEDLVWFVRHCGNGQLYPASPGKTP